MKIIDHKISIARSFLMVLACWFLCACNKSEKPGTDVLFEVPVITGYKLIDQLGTPIGVVGIPNGRSEVNDGTGLYRLLVGPIPASNLISLRVDAPINGGSRQIWIKGAMTNETVLDHFHFGTLNMNAAATVFDTTFSGNDLSISVGRLPNGYYRLYVRAFEKVLYENIVINK